MNVLNVYTAFSFNRTPLNERETELHAITS